MIVSLKKCLRAGYKFAFTIPKPAGHQFFDRSGEEGLTEPQGNADYFSLFKFSTRKLHVKSRNHLTT
jgi:hypothetical protein